MYTLQSSHGKIHIAFMSTQALIVVCSKRVPGATTKAKKVTSPPNEGSKEATNDYQGLIHKTRNAPERRGPELRLWYRSMDPISHHVYLISSYNPRYTNASTRYDDLTWEVYQRLQLAPSSKGLPHRQDKIAKDQWRGARVSWDGGGEGGPGKCDSAQDSLLELHLESRKAMNSFKEYIRENCKKKKTAGDLLESEN
ncbi:hypothetical protein OOU_Y34scaffold00812g5 [Pyricularia oryzae Y34]|uniref:Uncharacterized protein n=2 Tax=Pyricularia oryzae TaxID=318829 RepID=A0AA97NPX8_PYRO3|nr:hypothetical protein OOU_Y34scaffold00812g5 [Pyricularia oryzae Y34]